MCHSAVLMSKTDFGFRINFILFFFFFFVLLLSKIFLDSLPLTAEALNFFELSNFFSLWSIVREANGEIN